MGVSYQSHQSRCLGTSLPVQCQRIKGAETGWWSDLQGAPRCSTFASPEGPGTGVSWWIAGSKARSVYFQIVAFIQVDSLHCWRWSVADGGKITVLTLVLWREASHSSPEMSFGSSTCTISTCVDETCWCIDNDHCPEEVLLDRQTCEEDVCLLSVARCCCLLSADGALAPRESESCSTIRSDWTGSRWTTLLLRYASRKKFWVLLFTCGVVRAVHLELVESLSTPETILAIRRLSAQRGLPEVIYSDNAKGFTASPTALQRQFGHVAPEWKFIAPHSPWWGGWWKRLVQSVKSALKKTIRAHCLTRTELETTTQEVESCINSRPLTFVSDEPDDDEPLTPAHFLLGHGLGYIHSHSTIDPLESPSDLGHRYELRKSLLDRFWSVWTADYIRNLPPWRGFSGHCDLKECSLVLVQDLQRSRLKWPLGVVTWLIPGKDGVVRTVAVKTASGNPLRSVPRIHDLELVPHDLSDTLNRVNRQPVVAKGAGLESITTGDAGAESPKPYVTRYGRVIKPFTRMAVKITIET